MNVIADIAGQYAALIRLVERLPKQPIVLLGDLNDRGWRSKEVIQWAIDNQEFVTTLDSNHGDLLCDYFFQMTLSKQDYKPRYQTGIFMQNGGNATLSSYDIDVYKDDMTKLADNDTLRHHIDWLMTRPSHLLSVVNGQKYLFSHAPMNPNIHRSFEQFLDKGVGYADWSNTDSDNSYQWNRREPSAFHRDLPNTISVFGHNSRKHLTLFCENYKDGIGVKDSEMLRYLYETNADEVYGVCLDTSRDQKLTGLDLKTLTIYDEHY